VHKRQVQQGSSISSSRWSVGLEYWSRDQRGRWGPMAVREQASRFDRSEKLERQSEFNILVNEGSG